MIKIYGHPQTSAGRCYWLLEELGLDYERVSLNMKNKEHKSAEYLALNPNGKVPTLIEDDFVIWESMAINHYLAEKYQPDLLGTSLQSKALTMQWCYWGIAEYQKPLIDLLIQLVFVPEANRNLELISKSKEKVAELNKILDDHLDGREYMVEKTFNLADLNIASVAKINKMTRTDISAFKNLDRWLNNVCERKASQKVDALT
jgi:glutathione S-transferase